MEVAGDVLCLPTKSTVVVSFGNGRWTCPDSAVDWIFAFIGFLGGLSYWEESFREESLATSRYSYAVEDDIPIFPPSPSEVRRHKGRSCRGYWKGGEVGGYKMQEVGSEQSEKGVTRVAYHVP